MTCRRPCSLAVASAGHPLPSLLVGPSSTRSMLLDTASLAAPSPSHRLLTSAPRAASHFPLEAAAMDLWASLLHTGPEYVSRSSSVFVFLVLVLSVACSR